MLLKTLTLEPKHAGRQPIAFSKSPASYCKFSKVFLYGSRIDWSKTTWKETETKFYWLTGARRARFERKHQFGRKDDLEW